jgi:hypothetical protein
MAFKKSVKQAVNKALNKSVVEQPLNPGQKAAAFGSKSL